MEAATENVPRMGSMSPVARMWVPRGKLDQERTHLGGRKRDGRGATWGQNTPDDPFLDLHAQEG